jgi:hypothetical protein
MENFKWDGNMKQLTLAVASVCSMAFLIYTPRAEAGGNHQIRADLPCPFGPGSGAWTQTATPSPFNAGLAGTTPVTLQGSLTGTGAINNEDELGLVIVSAVQYDSYAAPPTPPVGGCTEFTTSTGPLSQVIDYGLNSASSFSPLEVWNGTVDTGTTLSLAAGDREKEFNYDSSRVSLSTTGTASFSLGGITYTSSGSFVPSGTDNDFLFDSSGKLLGGLGTDQFGDTVVFTGVPTGWTAGTSGTISAPEIDPSSAVAGLTLLAGVLVVLRGGRRSLKVSH